MTTASMSPAPWSMGIMIEEDEIPIYDANTACVCRVWPIGECEEVAEAMASGAPRFEDPDACRFYVRSMMMEGESPVVIDNVAEALWHSNSARRCNRCKQPMVGENAACGACQCGGLIEARESKHT